MNSIATNLQLVHQRIENARKNFAPEQGALQVLAVTKNQSTDKIKELLETGTWALAENYAQEGIAKIQALALPDLEWHFIGHLQGNKTALIAQNFSWVHTLSSGLIAKNLNDARSPGLPALNVCIQINIDQEPSKSGIDAQQLTALATLIMSLPRLRLRGLMAIPAPRQNFEEQRKPFRQLAQLLLNLQRSGFPVDTLSMGMSQDLEAAIAEGATILRIGTAIFGERV